MLSLAVLYLPESPSPHASIGGLQVEQELRNKRFEEADLAECTFKPKTHWDLIGERRQKVRQQKLAARRTASPSRSLRPTKGTVSIGGWLKNFHTREFFLLFLCYYTTMTALCRKKSCETKCLTLGN